MFSITFHSVSEFRSSRAQFNGWALGSSGRNDPGNYGWTSFRAANKNGRDSWLNRCVSSYCLHGRLSASSFPTPTVSLGEVFTWRLSANYDERPRPNMKSVISAWLAFIARSCNCSNYYKTSLEKDLNHVKPSCCASRPITSGPCI